MTTAFDKPAVTLIDAVHDPLSLEAWQALQATWPPHHAVYVALPNTLDVSSLAHDLQHMTRIALSFPKWVDGRAYSQARLLRSRLGYEGTLCATGDVVVDMLPLLARSGFDAAVLRADQCREHAPAVVASISSHYQGDVLQPQAAYTRPDTGRTAWPANTKTPAITLSIAGLP
jgi:uncharacterized protein (DUF934 family)